MRPAARDRPVVAPAGLCAHVEPADEAQAVADPVADMLRHRRRRARLLPFRRLDHPRRREVVEGHVFRVAGARPEAARAQNPGNAGERGHVLGVVPGVERGLDLRLPGSSRPAAVRRRSPARARRPAGFARLRSAAGACDALGHALRPGRQVLAADRQIGRALQHRQDVEIVGRDRDDSGYRRRSSAAAQKAGHPLPFGNVLEIVPVVELVLGDSSRNPSPRSVRLSP